MMQAGFAESTIEATIHVICHEPHGLKKWLAEHPPGHVLERVARERIEQRRAARKREGK